LNILNKIKTSQGKSQLMESTILYKSKSKLSQKAWNDQITTMSQCSPSLNNTKLRVRCMNKLLQTFDEKKITLLKHFQTRRAPELDFKTNFRKEITSWTCKNESYRIYVCKMKGL